MKEENGQQADKKGGQGTGGKNVKGISCEVDGQKRQQLNKYNRQNSSSDVFG
ncbi:MAG: hypothetical protein QMD32_03860 [Smithellaceae bacterium]|nr:hypothetical protein [Smithellaceae bacterium]